MICKTCGTGRHIVNVSVHDTNGAGRAVFIKGGDRPHVGGVALASPGVKLHGRVLSGCDLWTMTVPGHKDVELAQKIAKKLCKATGEPVAVSLGIHMDNATADDINMLCDNVEAASDMFLEEYLKKNE